MVVEVDERPSSLGCGEASPKEVSPTPAILSIDREITSIRFHHFLLPSRPALPFSVVLSTRPNKQR